MSKKQHAYTPEQERAMAIARVERKMSAPDVVAAAHAGELDGLESFDPSVSTVDRCKRAYEEELQIPERRHVRLLARSYDLLEALAREAEAEHETSGKVPAVKLRQLTQALRNLNGPTLKPKPEKAEPEQESKPEPDDTSPLLARLSTAHDGQRAQRSTAPHQGRQRAAS